MKIIGEHIREARRRAHLTQEELAKKINLSRSHIGAIETNRYNPSLSTLQRIADAVGVEVISLLSWDAQATMIAIDYANDMYELKRNEPWIQTHPKAINILVKLCKEGKLDNLVGDYI